MSEEEQKFFDENKYPDGEIIPCDCDECGEWEVGEHRCLCGNRRTYQCVEKSYGGNSFYISVECY